MKKLSIEDMAKICHQANVAYSQSVNDGISHVSWEECPQWHKSHVVKGVVFFLKNPHARPEDLHKNWLATKEQDGWVYGEEKDEEKKTHPCIVPFEKLPQDQQMKNYLFRAVCRALYPLFDGEELG